ncbi:hypothetical protein [Streptomyces sp. NBC_00059]|uniref:hypothetical protein n=1 Tax=Streptomyces sp. NBC_00059 TaxID=2975635 RepID=UPI00224D450C|nr:hypothetical protein [Streptomyces sp. NBC_00059]MCX5411204.1 hypothetical protein [Streptomyces sp. NBC_00059]
MGQTWGALAVAVVGVIGTLGAALLTQSRADRLKRHELEATARQQREDRAHAEQVRQQETRLTARRELTDLRRACYISLNTTARQYQTAQINLMHVLRARDDAETQACAEQLEARRLVLRDSYAEAQMIVPGAVLADARATNHQLNKTYGLLKRMMAGGHPSTSELDALEIETEMSWALLSDLRAAMRHDLGVDDASEE